MSYRIGLTEDHVIDDSTGHHYRLKTTVVVMSYTARNPVRRSSTRTMYRTLKRGGKRDLEIRAFIAEQKANKVKYFVVKDKQGGKFADGFYGWDSNILSSHQIFTEDELPFKLGDERFEFIEVGKGKKPSEMNVRDFLFGKEEDSE